jgi:hypothetical protein
MENSMQDATHGCFLEGFQGLCRGGGKLKIPAIRFDKGQF